MHEYFSEKELGKKDLSTEVITSQVWNGIYSVFEKYKNGNFLSESFPEQCPDQGMNVCGFDQQSFEDRARAEIPNLPNPLARKKTTKEHTIWSDVTGETATETYSVLDFIE